MLINGLNRTRILIALVLVLLLNEFLYCPRAAHSFSKETCSVKLLLLGQSKTSYYKVLLYEHSNYILTVHKVGLYSTRFFNDHVKSTRTIKIQVLLSPFMSIQICNLT
jgi:hypothetical protein